MHWRSLSALGVERPGSDDDGYRCIQYAVLYTYYCLVWCFVCAYDDARRCESATRVKSSVWLIRGADITRLRRRLQTERAMPCGSVALVVLVIIHSINPASKTACTH